MNEPFPVTITLDRYGGSYSKGRWTAWPLRSCDIPKEPSSDDPAAQNFWMEYQKPVGLGDTPQEAFKDLELKLSLGDKFEGNLESFDGGRLRRRHYQAEILEEPKL